MGIFMKCCNGISLFIFQLACAWVGDILRGGFCTGYKLYIEHKYVEQQNKMFIE